MKRSTVFVLTVSFLAAPWWAACTREQESTGAARAEPGEWRWYGADQASSKYSPLDQIDAGNVGNLRVVWRWTSPDEALREQDPSLWTWLNESTPIMVGGVLYTSTSMSQVAAVDAATGETLWVYDPQGHVSGPPPHHYHHRGVAYWEDGDDERIFIATHDAYLIALDAGSGKPIASFGEGGRIDLTQGLRRAVDRFDYGVVSPPVICRDAVIVGSTVQDDPRLEFMPPGDVRAVEARTGEQRWIFESVPQGDAYGVETWEEESWKRVGNTNVWTMMSCDEDLGYAYLPFSSPTNDYYGGERPGDNLFDESLVAVDATTGQRVWHFQIVHHGLWDYDLPAAPNLVDVTVDGRRIQAVAQVTKQAFTFVFDRVTGEPVWPIEERPVPQSQAPGERSSPTQPFPTKPLPFDRQGITEDDLIDFTPEIRQAALEVMQKYDPSPLYAPPSERGVIQMPGAFGGASWAGAAVDPGNGILFVPSITRPMDSQLVKPDDYMALLESENLAHFYEKYYHFYETGSTLRVLGVPMLSKPPYGRITAIDLNTGEHLWMQPVGDGPRNHRAFKGLDLPPLGWPSRIQVVLTKTLLFAAQEGDYGWRGMAPRGNSYEWETKIVDPSLRALDPADGHLIAEIPLPGNANGAFITYMVNGKQYVAIPIGGSSQPAELIALALP